MIRVEYSEALDPPTPASRLGGREDIPAKVRVRHSQKLAVLLSFASFIHAPNAFAADAFSQTAARRELFRADFEGTNALSGWNGNATLGPGFSSGQSVALESRSAQSSSVIAKRLDAEPLQGCILRGSAMLRAEGLSAKPNPWNGIKFMLVIEGRSPTLYPQAPIDTGSFDWRRASFRIRVPPDATNLTLVLGLEQVTGKVWFDNIKLVEATPPARQAPKPAEGASYKGHSLPRLRGAMISPDITPESLRVLGHDWNANLIRWQLIRSGPAAKASSGEAYDAWLEGELKKVDAALPHCEKNGLLVALDLHSPPGGKPTVSGYAGSDSGLFTDRNAQQQFVDVWRRIAARYRDAKSVWGYDLANEPVEEDVEDACDDWQDLAERAARAIRTIDPRRAIIVEPTHWGSPDGLNDLVPIGVSNVVYSVHMYIPMAFTHQGVFEKGLACRYPGVIHGKEWNQAALERALQPAIDFQKKYNVQIYIGEFSAIRWAPDHSAARYLNDLIEIFEAHGWDWSYHAFREWQGWSVEHGPDPQDAKPAATITDRQQLLCDWFARNQKPQ